MVKESLLYSWKTLPQSRLAGGGGPQGYLQRPQTFSQTWIITSWLLTGKSSTSSTGLKVIPKSRSCRYVQIHPMSTCPLISTRSAGWLHLRCPYQNPLQDDTAKDQITHSTHGWFGQNNLSAAQIPGSRRYLCYKATSHSILKQETFSTHQPFITCWSRHQCSCCSVIMTIGWACGTSYNQSRPTSPAPLKPSRSSGFYSSSTGTGPWRIDYQAVLNRPQQLTRSRGFLGLSPVGLMITSKEWGLREYFHFQIRCGQALVLVLLCDLHDRNDRISIESLKAD